MVRPSSETRAQRQDALRNLVATLRANDRSVAWLARRIDTPPTTLANYLSGERRMPEGLLERISSVLGIPASVLAPTEKWSIFTQPSRKKAVSGKAGNHDPHQQRNTSESAAAVASGGRRVRREKPTSATPDATPTQRRRRAASQPASGARA